MIELLKQPWPWYVAGAIIGLIVPALLILGNKHFGISANLSHACAACFPSNIKFFNYEWKKEVWNFFFVGGILVGAIIAVTIFNNPAPIEVNPKLVSERQEVVENVVISKSKSLCRICTKKYEYFTGINTIMLIILSEFLKILQLT
jgi:hypothetical protein